ncbi:anthranilate synthase component II [Mangrovibacillus cuniculi]|uniref:Aminodeoxychorismate/anthranilate synthase component II n=1 Tax=Mangrovibacillus cuniculi TaxID=2593652 RepID=A0A7S8CDW0_9BACI|nr:aminodeoxychorismate/anthranilate synthase component II [Mangrovibacillus cuniculi]QPC47998.1 aminodeoxychorismate/anthranilate synthase component II [Mangrovibacillus cuniculi]
MIVMIDNYDSFTYNLVQYFGELGQELLVKRNDQISLEELKAWNPSLIIISPGPCTPNEAGISLEVIKRFAGETPIFGVCLGHQAIAQVFGGNIIRSESLMHGKTSVVKHDGKGLFKGVEQDTMVTRYHSLTVEKESIPSSLQVTSIADDGDIMGLRHTVYPIESVQFHPESIMTAEGKKMVRNVVEWAISYRKEQVTI